MADNIFANETIDNGTNWVRNGGEATFWETLNSSDGADYVAASFLSYADGMIIQYEKIMPASDNNIDVEMLVQRRSSYSGYDDPYLKVTFMYYDTGDEEWKENGYAIMSSGSTLSTSSWSGRSLNITINPALVDDWAKVGLKFRGINIHLGQIYLDETEFTCFRSFPPGRPF